jgi:protein-L-isoaspartate(D-aspartate) O-methyltransferase
MQMKNYDFLREEMLRNQIISRGIHDKRLHQAFLAVKRHLFVDDSNKAYAYGDHPLSIGYGQTISQPYIVAYMLDQLDLKSTDRVLEIGTGSGYQTALLSHLVQEVYTIEVVEELLNHTKRLLSDLGYENIFYKEDDGHLGWIEKAPFDKIVVTCASSTFPDELINQLKIGGKMIIPVGYSWIQHLYLISKYQDKINKKQLEAVRFVPMIKK